MEKALEMGKTSTIGSFQLFVGKMVSTAILAIGTIILTAIIAEGEYGLYAIALIPATTVLLFQDWGIGSAMTKFCAQYRNTEKSGELRRIIRSGFTFEVVTGVILMMFSLTISNFVSSTIFGKPEAAFLVILASITVLSQGIFAASYSVFVGFERMSFIALILIFQAITQGVVAPLLVYLGYGALGAIIGYILASIVSASLSVLLLYLSIFRKLEPDHNNNSTITETLRPLLSYGVPLAISTILAGILPQILSFLMAAYVDVALIGNYRTATNFAILLTFFSVPITTVLFPTFSKLDNENERQTLKTVFSSSIKYASLFLIPATLAMMVLSKPLIGTLYGTKWLEAPIYLSLSVIINLFAIFGSLSLGSLLQGLGETKLLMKMSTITISIGVPLGVLLIPPLGVIGLIIVIATAGIPGLIIGLQWVWKHYEAKPDFSSSAKIFLASLLAAATTYVVLTLLTVPNWMLLTTGIILFLAIYLTATPLIGAINQADINNLRAMLSGLGIISKLIDIPLAIMQKILNVRSNNKNPPAPIKQPPQH